MALHTHVIAILWDFTLITTYRNWKSREQAEFRFLKSYIRHL
jgi:hypothetical protein